MDKPEQVENKLTLNDKLQAVTHLIFLMCEDPVEVPITPFTYRQLQEMLLDDDIYDMVLAARRLAPKSLVEIAAMGMVLFSNTLVGIIEDPTTVGIYFSRIKRFVKKQNAKVQGNRVGAFAMAMPRDQKVTIAFSMKSASEKVNDPSISDIYATERVQIGAVYSALGLAIPESIHALTLELGDLQALVTSAQTDLERGVVAYNLLRRAIGTHSNIDYENTTENLEDLGRRFLSVFQRVASHKPPQPKEGSDADT